MKSKSWWTTENAHIKRVGLTVYVLLAFIFVPLFIYKDHKNSQQLISECTAVTTGYVDDKYTHYRAKSTYTHVAYHYVVGDTQYNMSGEYIGKTPQFSISQSYPLHYDPDTPSKNYLGDTPPSDVSKPWTIFILFGAVLAAIDLIKDEIKGDDAEI